MRVLCSEGDGLHHTYAYTVEKQGERRKRATERTCKVLVCVCVCLVQRPADGKSSSPLPLSLPPLVILSQLSSFHFRCGSRFHSVRRRAHFLAPFPRLLLSVFVSFLCSINCAGAGRRVALERRRWLTVIVCLCMWACVMCAEERERHTQESHQAKYLLVFLGTLPLPRRTCCGPTHPSLHSLLSSVFFLQCSFSTFASRLLVVFGVKSKQARKPQSKKLEEHR